ncbi:hypothetical protein C8R44DRAFT_869158 [Mycena epipterygia]|nr:hypothetical protein C8R44DRAFT_869158 [Mycena epipterygia]
MTSPITLFSLQILQRVEEGVFELRQYPKHSWNELVQPTLVHLFQMFSDGAPPELAVSEEKVALGIMNSIRDGKLFDACSAFAALATVAETRFQAKNAVPAAWSQAGRFSYALVGIAAGCYLLSLLAGQSPPITVSGSWLSSPDGYEMYRSFLAGPISDSFPFAESTFFVFGSSIPGRAHKSETRASRVQELQKAWPELTLTYPVPMGAHAQSWGDCAEDGTWLRPQLVDGIQTGSQVYTLAFSVKELCAERTITRRQFFVDLLSAHHDEGAFWKVLKECKALKEVCLNCRWLAGELFTVNGNARWIDVAQGLSEKLK